VLAELGDEVPRLVGLSCDGLQRPKLLSWLLN
jgi:hypothetical protein